MSPSLSHSPSHLRDDQSLVLPWGQQQQQDGRIQQARAVLGAGLWEAISEPIVSTEESASDLKPSSKMYEVPAERLNSYSCNGRCGAGCTGTALENAYTQDCFSHDICSWFNGASGASRLIVLMLNPTTATDVFKAIPIAVMLTMQLSTIRSPVLQSAAARLIHRKLPRYLPQVRCARSASNVPVKAAAIAANSPEKTPIYGAVSRCTAEWSCILGQRFDPCVETRYSAQWLLHAVSTMGELPPHWPTFRVHPYGTTANTIFHWQRCLCFLHSLSYCASIAASNLQQGLVPCVCMIHWAQQVAWSVFTR